MSARTGQAYLEGLERILTFNVGDFGRYVESLTLHPNAFVQGSGV